MKTIKKLAYFLSLSFIIAGGTTACNYLDVTKELTNNITLEEVFNNPGYTKRWHGNIFNCIIQTSEMGMAASTGFTGGWNILAGEVCPAKCAAKDEMKNGYNASSANLHRWATQSDYIRQGMILLERIKPLGTSSDITYLTEEDVKRMKVETQFLIAYSYYTLFELYGPVPIITDLADPNDTKIDYARASVDEVAQYIDGILVDVINSGILPTSINKTSGTGNDKYNLNEMVRPTKIAALALRAKLAVTLASPLFNGGYTEALAITNKDGKRLFPDKDPTKWVAAKTRLEELFAECDRIGIKLYYTAADKDGNVNPNQSVYELYQAYNDEIIWATAANNYKNLATDMEFRTAPRDINNGANNVSVSQESIDGFFMANGLEIQDNGSGYKEDGFSDVVNVSSTPNKKDVGIFNMYANREPRFYNAVAYQGRSWHIQPTGNANYTLDFSRGGGCDGSKEESPIAGALLYKFKNRTLTPNTSGIKQWGRPWIIYRLADFYLYYAEVCNEINAGDPNVITYLDKIRDRAGIPGYQALANDGKKNIIGDQSAQRRAIQRERQVELFTEGQRYFDMNRWMICEKGMLADQSTFSGMDMSGNKVTAIGEPGSFFRRTTIYVRPWKRAMYLYPVPYSEIQKSRLLVQNPLWN